MTIFTDGARTQGTHFLEDDVLSTGETIGAHASASWADLPVREAHGIRELQAATGEGEDLESSITRLQAGENLADVVAQSASVPEMPTGEAKARVKAAGLDTILHLPDQPTIRKPAFDIMLQRAQEKRDRDAAIARGAPGFIPNALAVGTSFLVSAVDPINLASAFIPVIGEMRYGKLLADAAMTLPATTAERFAVRAGVGAAQGAVGSIPIVGLEARARTLEGQDFTMAEALRNVMFGAALGGGLHSGGGAVADLLRTRRERPLYPFDRGEPLEYHTPYSELRPRTPGSPALPELFPGREAPGSPLVGQNEPARTPAAPEADPATPEPRTAEAGPIEPTPIVRALDDLPPRAKEDAMRVAIADLAEGRPVSTGDMLEAAARSDPRIAESLDAWHGSPRDDIAQFDIEKLGEGEGHQAFGHGLYFAEEQNVGASYRERLSRENGEVSQKAWDDPDIGPRLKAARDEYDALEKRVATTDDPRQLSDLQKQLGDANRVWEGAVRDAAEKHPPGALYKVRIKAKHDEFLDWDVELDKQPAGRRLLAEMEPKLREALEERLDEAGYSADLGELTGNHLHQLLLKHVGDDLQLPGVHPTVEGDLKQEVAHYLLGKGVAGIKYLDSGSRKPLMRQDLAQVRDAIRHVEADIERVKSEVAANQGNMLPAFYERRAAHLAALERNLAGLHAKADEIGSHVEHGTRNLVVFDPDIVEITHKNGEPVSRGERQEIVHEKEKGGSDAAVLAGPRAARGPRARDPETWSLNEFLASRGGLDPTDPLIGDVRSSIGASNKFVPGFGHLIRKGGMRLDEAREAAVEAGYLFDKGDVTGGEAKTNVNTLLDAVDRELRGQRVYRAGREPEKALDHEAHRAEIEREAHGALQADGIDPKSVPDKTMARVVEIMEREGQQDALIAYERAVMEETHYGAETGEHQRVPDTIPGWDVPHDAAAASAAGRAVTQGGERAAGATARAAGAGDRAAADAERVKDWQALARRASEADDPDILAASRAAEKLQEPASADPSRRQQAAENAAAIADQQYKDAEAYLPADLRELVEAKLKTIEQDGADANEVIRRGAACLAAAIGGAAA